MNSLIISTEVQIKAVFNLQDCKGENSDILIGNYKEHKITPRKNGWLPAEGTLYVCEMPSLEEPSFYYTENGIPVFPVVVLPWIIGERNDRVTELMFIDQKSHISIETLPQTTFGKEAIIYWEICNSKYVWVKNPQYVEKIREALTKKERQEFSKNPWKEVEGHKNLIEAPHLDKHNDVVTIGMYDDIVAKVITETINELLSKQK